MIIRYRHVSEPEELKIYDTEEAYKNNPFLYSHGISYDDFVKGDIRRFKRDKEKGIILEVSVY